jgi:NodT family efflux transporter outer membrane factor (OMF) lipoprotein
MNTLKRYTMAVLALVSVTACTVGPNFVRPEAPHEQQYTAEPLPDLAGAGAQHIEPRLAVDGDWWTQFGSTVLDSTVHQALNDNRNLAAAQSTLAAAQELLAARAATQRPQVSLAAGAGRQQYGAAFLGPETFPPFNYYSVGANVSYLLDYTGGLRRAVEAQGALTEMQARRLDAAHLALTGHVVLQAIAIASARAQIHAVEGILHDDANNVDLVKTALGEGSVAEVDLVSAQSQLAEDQTLLPPLHQDLSAARHALAVLVGRAPASWSAPDFDLEMFTLPLALPLSPPSELARRRPDIRADEDLLHAATAAIGVATASLYPQINLTASLSQESLTTHTLFDTASTAWGLAGSLSAPLYNGGRLRAQRRAAIDATHVALAHYQQTILEAFGQVADVLAALEHDAEEYSAQQRALDAAELNLKLTRESYSEGNVAILQVLDAERLTQRARIGYVRAQAQRMQDSAELFLALGGDIPAPAETPPPQKST